MIQTCSTRSLVVNCCYENKNDLTRLFERYVITL